jgi:hypothetical protein
MVVPRVCLQQFTISSRDLPSLDFASISPTNKSLLDVGYFPCALYSERYTATEQRAKITYVVTNTGWYIQITSQIRNIYLLELGIVTNRMRSVEIVARVILTHLLFNGLPRWPLMPYYAVRSEEHIPPTFSCHFGLVVYTRARLMMNGRTFQLLECCR